MKSLEPYSEETQLDGKLYKHPSVFSPNSSYLASITGTYVIIYDVKTGKRYLILTVTKDFCGLKWQDENTLLAIETNLNVSVWDVAEGVLVSQFNLAFNGRLLWTYDVDDTVFGVALTNEKDQVVLRLDLDNKSTSLCIKLPVKIMHRRALFPTERFVLYCEGPTLHLLPYQDVKIKGSLECKCTTNFPGVPKGSVVFNSVTAIKDSVFAVTSKGRIYYWHGVNQSGLAQNHKAFIHAHYSEPCIAITPLLTIFCGTANSRVDKWNVISTGGGRYERYQVMERMDAPVEMLCLSSDSSFLLAIMADNSMLILNTVSLAVVSRPSSLHWSAFYDPLNWLGLCTDIEHPDYIVMNGRTGYVQWVDPVRWRTIGEFDVSKENPPPRDCAFMPKQNWTNVYAFSCTSSLIVTAECRRQSLDKTLLKFFYRRTPGAMYDIKEVGCIKLDGRVRFIRSNMEEVRHDPSERILRDHYVVTVDDTGSVQTYCPNSYQSYRWNADLTRKFDWHQTKIIDCSSIRSDLMATVNSTEEHSEFGIGVLIWDVKTASANDFIDRIPSVRQARWCPSQKGRPFVLLIAGQELIAAYDSDAKTFLWVTMEPGMSLYTNLFTLVVHDHKKVYIINHRDGSVSKRLEFTQEQSQVVATGHASNVRLSGLNSKGLSLLKPETEENLTLREIEIFTKSTPFSALIQQARADSQPASINQQLHHTKMLSAQKLFEGPAHSLASIVKLAPAFIESCLMPRAN